MLFGVFGISVGLLIVAIGIYALFDYSSENPKVEFENPEEAFRPESLVRSTGSDQRSDPVMGDRGLFPSDSPTESFPLGGTPTSPKSPGSATDEARQHAKSRQRTFVAKGNEVLRLLDECDQEIKTWADNVQALLENEAGQRIAGDQLLVRQFRVVYRRDRPSAETISELRTAVTDLIAPMKSALEDKQDARLPKKELAEEISNLHAEAKKIRDALREPREQIDSIVDAAKAMPLQPNTLRQAISDSQNAERLAEAQRMEQETTRANREAAERLAAAEAKRIGDEASATIAKQESEAEHARLVAKAKTSEVRHYLATFLAKGYYQPTGSYLNIKYVRTTDEKPVSFSAIKTSGALDKSVQGLRTLVVLASPGWSASGSWHDRPAWNFNRETFDWSKSDQEFIQRSQDLLRELGPTMVELKMLSE
jgi:hypothetical protein